MNAIFFDYPKKAYFGKTIPKSKIYEHGAVSRRIRDLFVQQVEQIIWHSKLAPETTNLSAKPGVQEIQIFRIIAKTSDFSMDILKSIDNVIQFPIIFEIEYDHKIKVVAAYKRVRLSDPSKWVISNYFSSAWFLAECPRREMPIALDLGELYAALLKELIPLNPRNGETLKELVRRQEDLKFKQKEFEKIKIQLSREKQFNRRVEINSSLQKLQDEIEKITL